MSVTITWLPNTEADIASYDWQRADDVADAPGTWTDLVSIDHDLLGANYDAGTGRFFYVDTSGSTSHWYRLRAVDTDGNASRYSNPFQPSESTTPPPFPNTVVLYEDYAGENSLQLTDLDGAPIDEAQVRVYKKIDYDLQNYDAVVGSTMTNATGGWVAPIYVEAGYTYVVHFFKPDAFGPEITEVVVP